MTRNNAGWVVGLVGWLLLSIYTFSACLVPVRADNDIWWHLKSGEYIAEHGIPKHDVFNFKAEDMEWHNHEWLSQLLLHGAATIGEQTGLGPIRGAIVFNGIITWVTLSLLYLLAKRLSGRWVVAFLVAVACVAIGRRMFYVRPPTITNLMLVLQLWLLIGASEGWFRRGWLWLLVPMIALWTNLHGGWMAAGVVLACWSIDQALAAWRDRLPQLPIDPPTQPVGIRFLLPFLPACLFATFFNPYIYHLYTLPARVLKDAELVRSIGELNAPDLFFVIDFELWTIGLFAVALLVRGWQRRLFEILIFFFFLHQAMQHVRHLSLFSVMMVPIAARLLGALLEELEQALRARWSVGLRVPSVALAGIGLYFMAWVVVNPREGGRWSQPFTERSYPGRNLQFLAMENGYIREAFPSRLCDFVELADISGPMFNQNYNAGYLIWRLAPERARVYTDSRFDIFGGALMRLENRIMGADPTPVLLDGETLPFWRAALREVDWIVLRQNTALWAELQQQPEASREWLGVAAFADTGLEVWVRASAENVADEKRWESARMLVGATRP